MANTKEFNLTVEATDEGEPPLSSSAALVISVVSKDEVPPSVVDILTNVLLENATVGTEVAVICAVSNYESAAVAFYLIDGKTPETNSEGTFSILTDMDKAECTGKSVAGVIVVESNVDYETIQSYTLTVRIINDKNSAYDYNTIIAVTDLNDNTPSLQQPFQGSISENSPDRSMVMEIKAVDKDVSPEFRQLTYSIHESAEDVVKETFSLDRNSGQLWTKHSLDREDINTYKIPVVVSDSPGGNEKSSIYWVTVSDVNDSPPKFNLTTGVYQATVSENRDVGKATSIKLCVDDPDIVSSYTYQIVAGNDEQKFTINSKTGEIYVNKKLDYDEPVNDRDFPMTVRVSDGIYYDTTDVLINVTNFNDQPPEFPEESYSITVKENEECNVEKLQVEAVDPDLPPDEPQNIFYSMTPEDSRNFTIDNATGVISIKGCLDREKSPLGMTIYVWATDEGGAGIAASPVPVEVTIDDLNDNHPFIQSPEGSRATIMENVAPSEVSPITIKLDDWDDQANGCPCTMEFARNIDPAIPTKFAITPKEDDNYFQLWLKEMLDREAKKFFDIPFNTTDSGGMSGIRVLTIDVGDENDSPMDDGTSLIHVYNYMSQLPTTVIGYVYVTDADDYDTADKTFDVDASTSSVVADHFEVRANASILMLSGTPGGNYTLNVKVVDNVRHEEAIGTVEILVTDLPRDAVMQSGSFRLLHYTSEKFVAQESVSVYEGTSMYDKVRLKLGEIFSVDPKNVDIFSLKDTVNGDAAVDVRFNYHGSPYSTSVKLNGLLLSNKQKLEDDLGISISMIDLNNCLYSSSSPCPESSCQIELQVEAADLILSETSSVVSIRVVDYYTCSCGPLEPVSVTCTSDYCLNGGTCKVVDNVSQCQCLDASNYGPRCELLTAKMKNGYAWFESLGTCANATLTIEFESDTKDALLLYSGPTVSRPWESYPGDFIYLILHDWNFEVYLDLGSGTMVVSVPVRNQANVPYRARVEWSSSALTVEVEDCGDNTTASACVQSTPLVGYKELPSRVLNVEGPLQLGGLSEQLPFDSLMQEYGWSLVPPTVGYFAGCFSLLKYNDKIYDMNYTDYSKEFYRTCADIRTEPIVKFGKQTLYIIIGSLLGLLLLILLVLCLARKKEKPVRDYPIKDFPMQTMGTTDIEGYGEKDMTQYDLNMLRVSADGKLLNGTSSLKRPQSALPDVAVSSSMEKEAPVAPLAQLPEGLSIGDFIDDTLAKVAKEVASVDDVRHYCFEGDEMSVASLSSLGSGSSDSEMKFDYINDWGPRFEKLAKLYGKQGDEEEESDLEFQFEQGKRGKYPRSVLNRGTDMEPRRTLSDHEGDYHETLNPLDTSLLDRGPESWC